jgi:hypothetical protein
MPKISSYWTPPPIPGKAIAGISVAVDVVVGTKCDDPNLRNRGRVVKKAVRNVLTPFSLMAAKT